MTPFARPRVLAVASLVALFAACSAGQRAPSSRSASTSASAESASQGESAEGVVLSGVTYRLRFRHERARRTNAGFEIRNDRGFEFEVSAATLTSHAASFVPCVQRPPTTGARAAFRRTVAALFTMPVARAGHGGARDRSSTDLPIIERLHDDATRTWSSQRFVPARYCRFHYVVARADEATAALANRPDLVGATLDLVYRARAPGAIEAREGRTRASFAHGRLDELATASIVGSRDGVRAADVLVERDLDGLFDGVDPATDSVRSIERSVLSALVRSTRVTITLRDP